MNLNNDNLVLDSDPSIRSKSQKVALPLSAEDKELALAMYEFVKNSQDEDLCEELNLTPAVGLAAIQVGQPKNIIAVVSPSEKQEGEFDTAVLANPRILSKSVQKSYCENGEGCLSVPDMHEGVVLRNARIKVKGFDVLQDKEVTINAEGFFAVALQHEIDHLKGILYYDHINENDPFLVTDETAIKI